MAGRREGFSSDLHQAGQKTILVKPPNCLSSRKSSEKLILTSFKQTFRRDLKLLRSQILSQQPQSRHLLSFEEEGNCNISNKKSDFECF